MEREAGQLWMEGRRGSCQSYLFKLISRWLVARAALFLATNHLLIHFKKVTLAAPALHPKLLCPLLVFRTALAPSPLCCDNDNSGGGGGWGEELLLNGGTTDVQMGQHFRSDLPIPGLCQHQPRCSPSAPAHSTWMTASAVHVSLWDCIEGGVSIPSSQVSVYTELSSLCSAWHQIPTPCLQEPRNAV